MLHSDALKVAEEVVSLLRPACHRLEVAGSLRRGKDDVKDIEIVALPIWDGDPLQSKNVGHSHLDGLLMEETMLGTLRLDEAVKRDGMKYKRLMLCSAPAVVIELFLATPANYGNTLLIRTGNGDFSRLCVTQWLKGGLLPNFLFHKDGFLWKQKQRVVWGIQDDAELLSCRTEEEFFAHLGIAPVDPAERTAETVERLRRAR